MPDQITNLIELAMSSTSDAEKLAALAQAKRIYKNQGVQLPKRIVRETTTVPQTGTEVEDRAIASVQAAADKRYNKLLKDHNRLTTENAELTTKLLNEQHAADDEVILAARAKVINANVRTILTAFLAVVVIAVMSL